jgi:4-hydroxy-tetrahydrodipicolinate synthase
MLQINGVITAMATPFDEDGSLDLDAAKGLAAHILEQGSHAIVVAGSTGECPTLTDGEELELLAAVRAEVGAEAVLIAGTGTNDTQHSRELTKMAADAGADASLVVVPYYNNPNPAGIKTHFEAVAAAVPELPMVVYNIPARVVVNADLELLRELATIDNIVAVKQSNADELAPIEGVALLAGDNETFCDVLELGGDGGILVASNIVGDRMRDIWDAAQAGDFARAREIDDRLRPLYEALALTTNPVPLKAALELVGLAKDSLRLPLVSCDEEQRSVIRAALEGVGLAVAR